MLISPNIMWKGGGPIPGVTQRTESGQKGRGVMKGNLRSGNRGSELAVTEWGEHRASSRSLSGPVLMGGGHGGCHGVSLTLHVVQVCRAQHLSLRLVSGHLLLWATQAAQGTAWA